MARLVLARGAVDGAVSEIARRIGLPQLLLPNAGEGGTLPVLRVDGRFGATHGMRTSCAGVRTSCAPLRTSCAHKNQRRSREDSGYQGMKDSVWVR